MEKKIPSLIHLVDEIELVSDVLGGEIHVHIKNVPSSNIMVRRIKGWLHKECIY